MKSFPTSLLQLDQGFMGPHLAGGHFLRICLKPFRWDNQEITTALRWDGLHFIDGGFAALQRTKYAFERSEGDASIYSGGAHHPIDISSLTFGSLYQSSMSFTHEGLGDYGPTIWSFTCLIDWVNEAQTA